MKGKILPEEGGECEREEYGFLRGNQLPLPRPQSITARPLTV